MRAATITITINPVIGHLGPFTIHWYSTIMALATLVGGWIFAAQVARRGIAREHVVWMALVAIPSAIVGARLFHVLDNLSFYTDHPLDIVKSPYIGLAIFGVMFGGFIALAIYSAARRLPVLKVLDSLALALPVGQVIGRFANIINGDTWAVFPAAALLRRRARRRAGEERPG